MWGFGLASGDGLEVVHGSSRALGFVSRLQFRAKALHPNSFLLTASLITHVACPLHMKPQSLTQGLLAITGQSWALRLPVCLQADIAGGRIAPDLLRLWGLGSGV